MMNHYANFEGIEIVYSDLQDHGIVTVYCEKPDPDECFQSAQFALPGCAFLASAGFHDSELQSLKQFVHEHEADILQKASDKGESEP